MFNTTVNGNISPAFVSFQSHTVLILVFAVMQMANEMCTVLVAMLFAIWKISTYYFPSNDNVYFS